MCVCIYNLINNNKKIEIREVGKEESESFNIYIYIYILYLKVYTAIIKFVRFINILK